MLKVDADALHAIGAEVTAVAGRLRKLPDTGLSPTASPGSAAAAARTAERAWHTRLQHLACEVAAFGTTLTDAAARYARADDANADDLRSGERPSRTPRPGTTTPAQPGTTTPGQPGTTTPAQPGTTTPGQPGTTTPAASPGAADAASRLAQAEPYVAALTGMAFGQALIPEPPS
ncbi:hypothetical protein Acy02nite_16380 [Actinoplanes cyaneus]|uniref:Uncharacterized protein n=1 Tax=Actinoplanes cyaneus TaxID=52696 RepID=A0A919M2S3_9ACTN|nr:hypothetical protein [Actinoplanes cyaneus]MCW2142086.1 hypothetical protein [Actinoplanes cyaneus]GID63757.1 hypothetical protein Acy02nite_16380 [Actinoplanes cyaneus]